MVIDHVANVKIDGKAPPATWVNGMRAAAAQPKNGGLYFTHQSGPRVAPQCASFRQKRRSDPTVTKSIEPTAFWKCPSIVESLRPFLKVDVL